MLYKINKMKTEISDLIQTTSSKLLSLINSFDDQQIKAIPFEGSWMPAQAADHLIKSCNLILTALHGSAEKTERDPESNRDQIKNIFLDFNLKFQSPEMIRPSGTPAEKVFLVSELTAALNKIREALETMDLSVTALDVELPGLGKLTKIDWLYFFVFHTQRHIHQLETIRIAINKIHN